MKRILFAILIAASSSACATNPPPPAVVCPSMQSLSPDWQKGLADEIRDASAKNAYPKLRESIGFWGALRRQLRAAGCK